MQTFDDYKKSRLGTKYIRRLKLPNTELEVGLRVLTTGELLEAEAGKIEYISVNKLKESEAAVMLENNIQVLYRSAVQPDAPDKKFFTSVTQVRELLAEDINWLSEQYNLLASEINPLIKPLTETDIDEIKKKLESGEIPIGLNYTQLLQALMVLGGFKSTSKSEAELSSDNPSNV
jgi:phage FluMu protein gp41